ncbi:neprilysin-11-like [Contarinia nasturtii]|uniref:neprilysin-11-like n=1 Tax=Contarinia nasturtii TaxID=265458 RepID=UPI0012D41CD0|nr:neprilysin-11-like [Contarinia nasturtii]
MPFLNWCKNKRYMCVALTLLLFIGITSVIVLNEYSNEKPEYMGETCSTDACHQTAENLFRSMDFSVDPCSDFYQFTCGNWNKKHHRPNYMELFNGLFEGQFNVFKQLQDVIEANETANDPESVKQSRIFYRTCMNTEQMDALGLKPALQYLRSFHLPNYPSVTLEMFQSNASNANFDWIESVAEIKKVTGVDIIIGFSFLPDFKNHSISKILFSMPSQKSIFEVEKNIEMIRKIEKFADFMKNVVIEFAVASNQRIPKMILDDVKIFKIFQMEATFSKFQLEAKSMSYFENINFSSSEFKTEIDQMVNQYLKTMFRNIDPNFNASDYKILKFTHYLHNVMKYISTLSKVDMENYIWWKAVEQMIPLTTTKIKKMHDEIMKIFTENEAKPKWFICSLLTNKLFGMALSHYLVKPTFINSTEYNTTLEMVSNIRSTFHNSVNDIDWIYNDTKQIIFEKMDAIESFLAFPEWIFDREKLDEYYGELNCSSTNHLENVFEIHAMMMENELKALKTPELRKDFDYDINPTTVNAAYNPFNNRITIPWAMLQYPLHNLGLEVLNYGALGSTVGHEWIHGFDNNGRYFDKDGNFDSWWPTDVSDEYTKRAKCFIDQYSSFYMPEIEGYVDGELSLNENIADNSGLRIAYYAYKMYVKRNGKEKHLPKFQRFTDNQLFFISFGNRWCDAPTPRGLSINQNDEHCPNKFRVEGVLSNSVEFRNAFKCSKHSRMVSKSPCRVW